jgi:hypothetical protein
LVTARLSGDAAETRGQRCGAEVDCKKQQRMSAKDASEYQRGWEAGYGPGYEFGYKNTCDKKCGNRK